MHNRSFCCTTGISLVEQITLLYNRELCWDCRIVCSVTGISFVELQKVSRTTNISVVQTTECSVTLQNHLVVF